MIYDHFLPFLQNFRLWPFERAYRSFLHWVFRAGLILKLQRHSFLWHSQSFLWWWSIMLRQSLRHSFANIEVHFLGAPTYLYNRSYMSVGWSVVQSVGSRLVRHENVSQSKWHDSSVHLIILSCIHSSIHSFVHSFIHSFIHSFVHSFIHSFVHSYIHPFIHSLVHSFMNEWMTFIESFIHEKLS